MLYYVNIFLRSGNSFSLSFEEEETAFNIIRNIDESTGTIRIEREDGNLKAKFDVRDVEGVLFSEGVADDEDDVASLLIRVDKDLTFRGKLDGIIEQVMHDAPEDTPVRTSRKRALPGLHL